VDGIDTGEILSRYFFNARGRDYCLLKLYSFAQAFSGNRIAGSIYGVGLLSDCTINLTNDNLGLLRAAKDNFAKLSLEGAKFKRSNFQDDTNRIWKAIVTSNKGNLLDKVNTSSLKNNRVDGAIAFYIKDLFKDAIKLDNRIDAQNTVYFSEDLEHLKRTQDKWGVNAFPICVDVNGQISSYERTQPAVRKDSGAFHSTSSTDTNDVVRLRAERDDFQHSNHHLKRDLKKLRERTKTLLFTIYGLCGLLLVIVCLWALFSGDKEQIVQSPPAVEASSNEKSNPLSHMLEDKASVDSVLVLFSNADFIYSFDVSKQQNDTLILRNRYKSVERLSSKYGVSMVNVSKAYEGKCTEINRRKNDAILSKDAQKQDPKKQEKVKK
jgi:hypothetical protein